MKTVYHGRQLLTVIFAIFVVRGHTHACDLKLSSTYPPPADATVQKLAFSSYKGLSYATALSSKDLKPDTQIQAIVIKPQGKAPFPAVVINHGSSGIKNYHFEYAQALVKQGFVVALYDGFCSRDIKSVVGQQEALSLSTTIADSYRLLGELAEQDFIKKDQIHLMGTSRGGSAAIVAVDEKFRKKFAPSGLAFRSAVAIYPGCVSHLKVQTPSQTKVLVQLASKDEYFPPGQCRRVIAEMKKKGFDIRVTEYAAPHGWDVLSPREKVKGDQNFAKCDVIVDVDGTQVEKTSGIQIKGPEDAKKAFAKCGSGAAYFGGDADAKRQSLNELLAFFEGQSNPLAKK